MNYHTNRTIQAVCAQALIGQIGNYRGSCRNIAMAATLAWVGSKAEYSLWKDYCIHSGAYTDNYGFYPFSVGEWNKLSEEAKQAYRVEMLYYFWLANQDGMDAFS